MNVMTGSQIAHEYWWMPLLRGIVAVLFGVLALFWPKIALIVLVALFGAFALLDGIAAVAISLREREVYDRWWILLIEGIAGILVGIITFFWPGITALVLLYLIATWAIITGILEIIAAFAMKRSMAMEWTVAIVGVLSIILGIILFFQPPIAGLFAVVWVIGAYALISGILLIIRAFQFRSQSPAMNQPAH